MDGYLPRAFAAIYGARLNAARNCGAQFAAGQSTMAGALRKGVSVALELL
jgi:hypothetical protein